MPVEEIDSIWRDRSYFLVPGATAAQRRPYRLLLEAMRDTGTGALGRFVRSGRESLCLVRARGDSLVLETLYLADDVYSDAEITEAVGTAEVKPPELELAHQIIDSLEGSFDPETLTSTYRRDLKALLEAKLDGVELPPADEPEETAAPAVDLLEALRASVEAAKTPAGQVRRGQVGGEGQEARREITRRAPPSRRHPLRRHGRLSQGVSRASGGDTLSASGSPGQAGCATGRPLAWS